jgi:ribose transport system substrate-binding protein
MLADRAFFRPFCSADRRPRRALIGVLLAGVVAAGCGGAKHHAGSADPVVRAARAAVNAPPPPLSAYRGPAHGPPAQPRALVVFVAADLTNEATAAVARGVQQAAGTIGWPLQILDGQATTQGQSQALGTALHERAGGVILGGFDAADQRAALRRARSQGLPVVGWQAAPRPGPDRSSGLFTNVTADRGVVARLAADYAIADSNGTAGAVIFTDSEYSIDAYTSHQVALRLGACRGCTVLQTVDEPIATATIATAAVATALLERFGRRWGYLLAVNGAYLDGARTALLGAGRSGDQPPFSVVAGEGVESEFARIRANDYERASVAEPLNLQGWQLIDELNRARARKPPSGFIAPPRLITQADVQNGGIFDPRSGYQQNYTHLWRR